MIEQAADISQCSYAPREAHSHALREAVHRFKAGSLDGIRERIFTLAFRGLVYPQIWEDPEVDLKALDLAPDSRMITIASGGCNVLSYLTANPAEIFDFGLQDRLPRGFTTR